MEFVQKFTPPDFQAKNCTPSISPNSNSFSKKKHNKWVKMEKFTPLAKILHCRRHWRHGQIQPLEVTLVRWTQPSSPLCLWQCLWFSPFYPFLTLSSHMSIKDRYKSQLDCRFLHTNTPCFPSPYIIAMMRKTFIFFFCQHQTTLDNLKSPVLCQTST